MTVHPTDEEGRVIPDASWPPGREAPGRLERVRRFLNTANPESGADHLGEPVRAGRWLAAEGWPAQPDGEQLEALRRLRRELHALIAAQSRGVTPMWPAALDTVTLAVGSTVDGPELTGTGAGVERVASDLAAIVVQAHADGSLARLAVCANGHCGWAFYDRSRNRTGQWCSMTACGQRQKMRRYRARQRGDRRPARD